MIRAHRLKRGYWQTFQRTKQGLLRPGRQSVAAMSDRKALR